MAVAAEGGKIGGRCRKLVSRHGGRNQDSMDLSKIGRAVGYQCQIIVVER